MNKLLVLSLTFALMVTAACQKTRDASFASGEGQNLYEVSKYNNVQFDIKTGEIVMTQQAPADTSAAEQEEQVKIDIEGSAFTPVMYQVSSPVAEKLLNGVVILGRPNFAYKGLIKVTEKTVTVYKIAKPSDIPAQESTYAEKQADGTVLVPLVEIAVDGAVNVDIKKNEVGEKTTTKEEKKVDSIAKAKFFKMDVEKLKKYEALAKDGILPVNYFGGEWYFSETTVLPEGADHSAEAFHNLKNSMTRVKFAISGESMRVIDAKLDVTSREKSEWNLATTMILDIERKAFKTVEFKEVEDTEMKLRARPFVKVDFATAKTLNSPEATTLVNVDVARDSLSFTLEDKSDLNRVRTRYTFVRIQPKKFAAEARTADQSVKQEQTPAAQNTQAPAESTVDKKTAAAGSEAN
jgi:hypothetical protein